MRKIEPDIGAPMLQMETTSLDFGQGAGVFDLSFSLQPGSILGVIGPSGCGKTTTIRLLNGIYRPSAGAVRVFGKDPVEFTPEDKARIGYIPQQFILYPYLSVEENLHFMGGMYGMEGSLREKRIDRLLDFVELEEARKRLGRHLSGGMKRRLMLAGALLHDPELIFADEPSAGIDPILRARFWKSFRQLRSEGRTLIITTQYVGEAAYCDCVAVMRLGRLVTIDSPEGLRRRAMGGDVIHLQVELEDLKRVLGYVKTLPKVERAELVEGERDGIYVYVKNASEALPELLIRLRENLGILPRTAEHHLPPFEEVFVRLIQQEDGQSGQAPWALKEKPPVTGFQERQGWFITPIRKTANAGLGIQTPAAEQPVHRRAASFLQDEVWKGRAALVSLAGALQAKEKYNRLKESVQRSIETLPEGWSRARTRAGQGVFQLRSRAREVGAAAGNWLRRLELEAKLAALRAGARQAQKSLLHDGARTRVRIHRWAGAAGEAWQDELQALLGWLVRQPRSGSRAVLQKRSKAARLERWTALIPLTGNTNGAKSHPVKRRRKRKTVRRVRRGLPEAGKRQAGEARHSGRARLGRTSGKEKR